MPSTSYFNLTPDDIRRMRGTTVPQPFRPPTPAASPVAPAPSRFLAPAQPPAPIGANPQPRGVVAPKGPITPPVPQGGVPVPAPAVVVPSPIVTPPAATVQEQNQSFETIAPAPAMQVAAPPQAVAAPPVATVQQPVPQVPTQQIAAPAPQIQETVTEPVQPATPTTPTTPVVDPFKSAMDEFYKQSKTWMSGQSDPAVRTALNHALDQIGLHNQAEMDALKMQINQDPTLRGQGAGTALLAMMARDQNFKVDDIIANMSEKNLERIVNMQKYGFESAMKLEGLDYSRREDLASNLIAAGDYAGAASLLQQNAERVAPGLGVNITAESLKNRDPYEVKRVSDMLNLVRDLAKTDSKAATSLLNSMIASNPMLKSWLPDGITADQLISTFVSGESAANAGAAATLGTSIRADIADGGDYSTVSGRLMDLFKLQNRNAIKEGEALSLERINEIRKDEGLPPLLDKNELDEVDYEELGYKNEFSKLQKKATEQPWQPLYDMIMQSPEASKFLDPALFPGGADAVKNFVIAYSTGLLDFEWDPETQTMVPSASNFKEPWENPDLYTMFYHMPRAVFDESGKVVGEYSSGGSPFSQDLPKTAEENDLQEKYASYIRVTKTSGGKPLSAPQWYFATAGGTREPNQTNIPESISKGTPLDPNAVTNVGTGGTKDYTDEEARQTFLNDPTNGFKNLSQTALGTKLSDAAYVKDAIGYGLMSNLTTTRAFQDANNFFWSGIDTGDSKGWVAINGKAYQIERKSTGDYTARPPTPGYTVPGGNLTGSFATVRDASGNAYLLSLNPSGPAPYNKPGVLYPIKSANNIDWTAGIQLGGANA